MDDWKALLRRIPFDGIRCKPGNFNSTGSSLEIPRKWIQITWDAFHVSSALHKNHFVRKISNSCVKDFLTGNSTKASYKKK